MDTELPTAMLNELAEYAIDRGGCCVTVKLKASLTDPEAPETEAMMVAEEEPTRRQE